MGGPVVGHERAGHAVAGVVDQPVHLQPALRQLFTQPLRRRRVGEIMRQRGHLAAVPLAQLVGQRFQAVEPARGQHQIMAAQGQLSRKGSADAGRGAGDQAEGAGSGHGGIPVGGPPFLTGRALTRHPLAGLPTAAPLAKLAV